MIWSTIRPSHRAVSAQRRVEALLADLEGQVTQAVSRDDWFRRWGRHYLPSLQRAHELRYCAATPVG